jgi:hypothetical protein
MDRITEKDLVLNYDTADKCEYQSTVTKHSRTHNGRKKLFYVDLQLLIRFYDSNTPQEFIYIGAAPGGHLYVLSKLFPNITFNLYDTAAFNSKLHECKNIKIYNKYFDDDDCKFWANKDVFFSSDIRSLNYYSGDDKTKLSKNEEIIRADMNTQKEIVNFIKPKVSMLKFRLPYEQIEPYNYLDGIIMFQPYVDVSSIESRLIHVRGVHYDNKKWDCKKYEECMSYHNIYTRETKFISIEVKPLLYDEAIMNYCLDSLLQKFRTNVQTNKRKIMFKKLLAESSI